MNKTFKINTEYLSNFELSENTVNETNITEDGSFKYHVIRNNTTYNTEILEANFEKKIYKVKVNFNTYNVNINNDLDELIKEMGFEVGASKKVNDIKAPMPGLILEINTSVGQKVKENDALLILEAMKMENIINAPRDGVVKSVSISKGDAVEKNQLLIEFE